MDNSQKGVKPTKPANYSEIAAVVMCSDPKKAVSVQNVTVHNPATDEYYQATLEVADSENGVLDEGHLYLEIIE